MDRVASLPCAAKGCQAPPPSTVHHCFTYMGGGRDHMLVVPLCWPHHLGSDGIDGKRISKRQWQHKYGSETKLLKQTEALLAE